MNLTDPAIRASIVAEWRRQAAEPVPPNAGPVGCAVAILAGLALVAVHQILALAHFAHWATIPLVVLIVAGFVFSQFGGSSGRNVMRGRVDRALATLAGDDAAANRAAAVALILNATDARGPSSSAVYDIAEMRLRLGPKFPLVSDVEQVLREELKIPAVFTAPPLSVHALPPKT